MTTTLDHTGRFLFGLLVLGAIAWWTATPRYEISEISVQQAKALIDSGALVVDVRTENAYEGRHIPGAISIPLEVLRAAIPESLEGVKAKNIVVYCGEGTTRGPEATHVLNQGGFSGAVNMKGGDGGLGGRRAAGPRELRLEA